MTADLTLDLDHRDDPDFVRTIHPIILGALAGTAASAVYLVKVDNWFGARWAGFSYKAVGALGIGYRAQPRIPPFVPNRILSQSFFHRHADRDYQPAAAPLTLHLAQTSADNARRLVHLLCPDTALFWWSGATRQHRSGSLMAYLPGLDGTAIWYADLKASTTWRPTLTLGTSAAELDRLAALHPA